MLIKLVMLNKVKYKNETKNSDILNVVQIKPGVSVKKDPSKDSLLTEFGRSTLKDRYLLPDEDYQGTVSYTHLRAHETS